MKDIDLLETEAMARAYDASKPDELQNKTVEVQENNSDLFFDISQLIGDLPHDEEMFNQSFRYVKMMDCDWKCHLGLLLNYKYGVLIPSDYSIFYSSCDDNSIEKGHIKFLKEKEYTLEYKKQTLEEYEARIKELEIVSECVEHFKNGNQIFYEFKDRGIYMYYEGYTWKLYGYTRNDITEYYNMYIILMSVCLLNNKIYVNDNFKKIYLISKNALNYLYKGIDLKKVSNFEFSNYEFGEDVVTFAIENNRYLTVVDDDYQLFNRKIKEQNEEMEKIKIYDNYFEGTFKTGVLGTYIGGSLLNFPEINDSTRLSEIEKRDLLENIVNQKQIELYEYKNYLAKKIINSIINDLRGLLTKDVWFKKDFVKYLKTENIDIEYKTEELLYDHFKYALDNQNDDELITIIDVDYLTNSIKPKKMILGPEFMMFACSILGEIKKYILFENNEFIEWK